MINERKDIVVSENDDLEIVNGDFVVATSNKQHVRDIFRSHKGEYKEYPLLGFGAGGYLKKNNDLKYTFLRGLKQQLRYDGYDNTVIEIRDFGKIKIDIE